jgi:DeoR family transcriptional regulator of aga operon
VAAVARADARRLAILDAVRESKVVHVAELSRRFSVSEVSIRRDLAKLAEYGLLTRVHGGAISPVGQAPDPSYDDKSRLYLEEKKRIGRAAAGLIHPGDRIILDSGTTVLQVALEVAGRAGLERVTAITSSLPAFRALAAARHVQLIVLGGIFLPAHQALVGPQTLANLQDLHADRLFLGTDGLTTASGITTSAVLEAEVSRAMVRAVDEVVVVTDSSKFGRAGLSTIMPLAGVRRLITDTHAPKEFVEALREQGVEVILV